MFLMLVVGVLSKASAITLESGTIRIAPDGTVDPVTAPIERNGDFYVLAGNVSSGGDGILIERSGIVFDGLGYSIQGQGVGVGVCLASVKNVTVRSVRVSGFGVGVQFENSSMSNLSENFIAYCGKAVYLQHSFDNWITGNDVKGNVDGFFVSGSSRNTVVQNNSTSNDLAGLYLIGSSHNDVCENCFLDNYNGIFLTESSRSNSLRDNTIESNLWSGIGLNKDSKENYIFGNVVERNKWHGIRLEDSSNNTMIENQIVDNARQGVFLENSTGNDVCDNSISGSQNGISLSESMYNLFRGNTLSDNDVGLSVLESSANDIFHNNFASNSKHVYDYSWDNFPDIAQSVNVWDDSYPSGGNYWSGHSGVDFRSGQNQNESGSDALSELPFQIDLSNSDQYPLMGEFADSMVDDKNHLHIVSNAALSTPLFDETGIHLIVLEESNATGFCRLTIPTSLINGSYRVFLNEAEIPIFLLLHEDDENSSCRYVYFTFAILGQEIRVVPEFGQVLVVCLLLAVGLLAETLFKLVKAKKLYLARKTSLQKRV